MHEIEWKNNGFLFTTPNIYPDSTKQFKNIRRDIYKRIYIIMNILRLFEIRTAIYYVLTIDVHTLFERHHENIL